MKLARKFYGNANASKYTVIYDANKKTIGPNPEKLTIGQVLTIPDWNGQDSPESPARTHTVVAGDTLMKLARKYFGPTNGSKFTVIYEANKKTIGSDPNKLKVGQVLTIPNFMSD
jgi:nucleoid-associated protein YgaU